MIGEFKWVLGTVVFSTTSVLPACADSNALKDGCMVPVTAASMATGTVVGTPIAIVRKTGSEFVSCVKLYRKDSNSYKFWGSLCSVPVAGASGLIKGTIYGAKNAVGHSINRPFGKDAFSLGELEGSSAVESRRSTTDSIYAGKPESRPWGTHE